MKTIHTALLTALLMAAISLFLPSGQTAAAETVDVVFEKGTSLRALASEHLGNPDEWRAILHFNDLDHPSAIRPGMRLSIPVGIYNRMIKALRKAGDTARRANMEGASILAGDEIDKAEKSLDRAMDQKKAGDLDAALAAAEEALRWAETALSTTKAKKIRSVSAILARKQGTVQSRKPREPVWTAAVVKQDLVEQERLRTLAASRAGVLFVDGSEIRMDENSLAVIGEMKENIIKHSLTVDVVVLKGDILAQLSSLSGRKRFSVAAPGVTTQVRSTRFRTLRDAAQATRIANYNGEIDVAAMARQVTIRKDEGTKVEKGSPPTPPRKLLPPPTVIAPLADQVFFTPTVRFQWRPIEKARLYVLEISADRSFASPIHIAQTESDAYEWRSDRKGIYYFRIHAIDDDRFPGPFSEPAAFFVNIDTTPPYLTVRTPEEGAAPTDCDSGAVRVRGTVETTATVEINGAPVRTDAAGGFDHPLSLSPGANTITVTAADPAGNRTTVVREATCRTGERLVVLETPQTMTVNVNRITLKGTLQPNVGMEIDGQPLTAPQRFAHMLTLPEGDHTVTVKATAKGGAVETLPVHIKVDTTPPEILPDPFPSMTRKDEIRISGRLSEPAGLTVGNRPVETDGPRFGTTLTLTEGDNRFTLTAVDAAGNRAVKPIRILRDAEPPDIRRIDLSPDRVDGAEILACRVEAEDDGAGLARTGQFSIAVGAEGRTFNGVLTLHRSGNVFEGRLFIPPGVRGAARIASVEIQDRLGNAAVGP